MKIYTLVNSIDRKSNTANLFSNSDSMKIRTLSNLNDMSQSDRKDESPLAIQKYLKNLGMADEDIVNYETAFTTKEKLLQSLGTFSDLDFEKRTQMENQVHEIDEYINNTLNLKAQFEIDKIRAAHDTNWTIVESKSVPTVAY